MTSDCASLVPEMVSVALFVAISDVEKRGMVGGMVSFLLAWEVLLRRSEINAPKRATVGRPKKMRITKRAMVRSV